MEGARKIYYLHNIHFAGYDLFWSLFYPLYLLYISSVSSLYPLHSFYPLISLLPSDFFVGTLPDHLFQNIYQKRYDAPCASFSSFPLHSVSPLSLLPSLPYSLLSSPPPPTSSPFSLLKQILQDHKLQAPRRAVTRREIGFGRHVAHLLRALIVKVSEREGEERRGEERRGGGHVGKRAEEEKREGERAMKRIYILYSGTWVLCSIDFVSNLHPLPQLPSLFFVSFFLTT